MQCFFVKEPVNAKSEDGDVPSGADKEECIDLCDGLNADSCGDPEIQTSKLATAECKSLVESAACEPISDPSGNPDGNEPALCDEETLNIEFVSGTGECSLE